MALVAALGDCVCRCADEDDDGDEEDISGGGMVTVEMALSWPPATPAATTCEYSVFAGLVGSATCKYGTVGAEVRAIGAAGCTSGGVGVMDANALRIEFNCIPLLPSSDEDGGCGSVEAPVMISVFVLIL